MRGSRRRSRFFVTVAALLGLTAAADAVYSLVAAGTGNHWMILAALTILTGRFTIRVPGANAKVSVADTLTFTNIVLFGVPAGVITGLMDGLTGSLRCKTVSRRLEFAIFNSSVMAVSAAVAGRLFTLFAGGPVLNQGIVFSSNLLPGLGILALTYYLTNSSLVALMVSIEQDESFFGVWRARFLWPAANYVAGAAVAGLLARTEGAISWLLVLTILSTIAAIYITSSSHPEAVAGSVDDSSRPAVECLDTVGTLAGADDGRGHWKGPLRRECESPPVNPA